VSLDADKRLAGQSTVERLHSVEYLYNKAVMKRVKSVGRLDGTAAARPAYPGARLVRRARDKAVAWSSYVKQSSVVATATSPVQLGSTVVRSLSRHSLKVGLSVCCELQSAL
jgi:hypothetical protein